MAEFFLELFCEEMPARMQPRACEDLVRLFGDAAKKADLNFELSEAFATPRRLALHVRGLPTVQANTSEELKGPRTDAPEAALAGFLKKTGLTKDQLEIRDDGKKGQVYFAVIKRDGRATSVVLADIIPGLIQNFPWPKTMRWGGQSTTMESLRWVRPLQSIVALFQGEIIPVDIGGVKSGNITRGHRFMGNSQFTVGDFEDYRGKLRRAHVILDAAERIKTIEAQARALAAKAGLVLVEDAGLLAENAGLTEWPVVLMGEFDAAFLGVPAEALTATMRANQKYFSLRHADGVLANKFLCVSNLAAKDKGKSIILGNQKVVSARLSDAKFFWDQDRQQKLESYLPKLEQIVFHEKLGTMAEKVARVMTLAEYIARIVYPQLIAGTAFAATTPVTPAQAGVQSIKELDTGLRRYDDVKGFVDDVELAAQLCKADLVTGMVGEFPELQGIMGRYYATARGKNENVAAAIEEHYKPQGPSDTVPTNPVSVCVALADKIDTLQQFFAIDEKPTGSRDPFGLRRAGLGIIRLILENNIGIEFQGALGDFLVERLKIQLRDIGIRYDIIDAVFYRQTASLLSHFNRTDLLQQFISTEDGTNLLAGYKRAANILKIEQKKDQLLYNWNRELLLPTNITNDDRIMSAMFVDGLSDAINTQMERGNMEMAITMLGQRRCQIDAFFNNVMINDPDPDLRRFRLNILAGIVEAMHLVADFSKIEG
jgi:glycyl-tRNA synthetase beta chain